MRPVAKGVGVVLAVLLLPAAAYAQASIAGQMRDVSGAVLPGVTVEAASAALIEKVRTAVTDGGGQYRVEILPPGTYSLTFTLPGFNTVKREGIQLSGTFTATIDTELRVGAIEETITVTGETPIVDVQSGTRQRVIDRDLIDGLPTGRTPFAQMALIPGVSVGAANQDVGGAFRLGTRRVNFSLDIYNALNVDTALTLNNAFATWQRPQSIILARFAKLGMQFDF